MTTLWMVHGEPSGKPRRSLTRGLTEVSLEDLPDLDPRVLAAFQDPQIEPADSFVLHVDDQVLGCIPLSG